MTGPLDGRRLRAATISVLETAANDGHTLLGRDMVLAAVKALGSNHRSPRPPIISRFMAKRSNRRSSIARVTMAPPHSSLIASRPRRCSLTERSSNGWDEMRRRRRFANLQPLVYRFWSARRAPAKPPSFDSSARQHRSRTRACCCSRQLARNASGCRRKPGSRPRPLPNFFVRVDIANRRKAAVDRRSATLVRL
jgi:hypothetical protein